MRKLLWIVTLFVTALSFSSCEKPYDDTEIWNSINSLEQRMTAMETVVNAYEKKLFIESVTQIENGYIISFSDGSKATIINGKDGINGTDGKDGLDGAPGKDGINGTDGKDGLDGAPGKDGDTYIEGITIGENEVTFKLTDGKQFSIPLYSSLSIKFDTESIVMASNSTREVQYTVESILNDISIEVISSADIKAKAIVDKDNSMTGRIEIKFGATIDEYSKVVVLVSNGEKVIMKTLKFEQEEIKVFDETNISVSEEGGEVELLYLSNVECEVIIPDSVDWISIAPATKALEQRSIKLLLEENKGAAREAVVTLQNKDASLKLEYTISQEPNHDYQLALEREALIAIYNALDGDNWTNNDNWCSDKPISEWWGVSCENGMNVTGLQIMGNASPNSARVLFPKEIAHLKYLKFLGIERTNIDAFPEEMNILNIEVFQSVDNIFLHLTDFAPIYKTNNLKSFRVVNFTDFFYDLSDTYKIPSQIPDELLNNKDLKYLCLMGCNLSGEIPDKLWKLTNLENLELHNFWETYLYGTIPPAIANLHNLKTLRFFNLNLSGGIPEELYTLNQLEHLAIDCCNIGGHLSSNIQNLKNLSYLNLRDCNLEGNLPEELAVLMDGNLMDCMLSYNKLTGNIPDKIKRHAKWTKMWTSIVEGNQFNLTIDDVPTPVFNTSDVWGNRVISEDVYKNNSYTIIYGFDIAIFPYHSNAVYSCNKVHQLYNAYKQYGVDVIMFDGSGYSGPGTKTEAMQKFLTDNNLPWTAIMSEAFGMTAIPYLVIVDSTGRVVYTTILTHPMFDDVRAFFEEKFPNAYYTSTDYTQDGKVTTLQTATKGGGIDIVLMGDAYSDRQIADGTYKADMENLYNNLFTKEPYKSFKDHFNVHYVNVVSATEGYEYGNTALDGYFGDGTLVGGNDNAVFDYALKAISEEKMDEALLIVAMNSDNYAGTCYMYYPESVTSTYGSGPSVAYFPKGGDAETFAGLLHHEACGHGFAKLADEYAYEDMGEAPSDYVSQIKDQQANWGWWKNVDFTSDASQVRWKHFLNDSRYQYEGLGAFEGGLTYWSGVWRPTEYSIMRYNTGGFNAPSREAIYYRIHKLAYGDEWEYDYEEFVEWDAKNRKTEASATRAPYRIEKPKDFKPTAPPVVINKNWRDVK